MARLPRSLSVVATREYNLGCAYFNEKEYGRAILHFEKARQLRPRDADIKHNLEFTRLFLKDRFDLPDPMPLVAWFTHLRDSVAVWELRDSELVLFLVTVVLIVFWRLRRNQASGRSWFIAVLATGLLLLINAGWLWERARSLDRQHAVLLVDQASVSSAPVPGSSTLFVIHEGTSGEILSVTDGWYEIRLPDGKTGWITDEVLGIY